MIIRTLWYRFRGFGLWVQILFCHCFVWPGHMNLGFLHYHECGSSVALHEACQSIELDDDLDVAAWPSVYLLFSTVCPPALLDAARACLCLCHLLGWEDCPALSIL